MGGCRIETEKNEKYLFTDLKSVPSKMTNLTCIPLYTISATQSIAYDMSLRDFKCFRTKQMNEKKIA